MIPAPVAPAGAGATGQAYQSGPRWLSQALCDGGRRSCTERRLVGGLFFGVGGEHFGDAGGEALARSDVQELVRTVGVGGRAERAGYEELCLGELLAEHAHEGD